MELATGIYTAQTLTTNTRASDVNMCLHTPRIRHAPPTLGCVRVRVGALHVTRVYRDRGGAAELHRRSQANLTAQLYKMGCANSSQPRHSPLVNQEEDPWDAETSGIVLSGWVLSSWLWSYK